MKYKISETKLYIGTLFLLVFALTIVGVANKKTYTNITDSEDYLKDFSVGEIPGNIAAEDCHQLKETLPDCKHILKVTAIDSMDIEFNTCLQHVLVQQVIKGDISIGEEIYITTHRWNLVIEGDDKTIERGFVNVLKTGEDYLIFCDEEIAQKDGYTVYSLFEDSFITPVFSCSYSDNVIIASNDTTTYVPYMEVKDNEFFAYDNQALEAWYDLKTELLKKYLQITNMS